MYPFQNPELPRHERIDNLLSLLTRDEKLKLLDNSGQDLPRLGVTTAGQVEGYHGAALGGPAGWGGETPTPTTQFCQAIGLGETWDPEIVRQAAEVEAVEFRYAYHRLGRGGLVVRAPNADLGRDPRWGRTEECYGEDPYLNGTLTAAFVQGLQGDDPAYLRTAALLKHFLANSNEDTRCFSSANFGDRDFREYYSVPFRMGFVEGGADCFMAAYNAFNGIPCTVHPMLKDIAMGEWGVSGIVCTDGGALGMLVSEHHHYPDNMEASAACINAGISQFLDKRYLSGVSQALDRGLITMEAIDQVLRRNLDVMMRLGLFDPPERVRFARVGDQAPWTSEAHRALARRVTQKSIVLLKNEGRMLPLDRNGLARIAVVGQRAREVLLDWYSGTPPYTVTPLQGIQGLAGPGVAVDYAVDNAGGAAAAIARPAGAAIVVVGNDPVCGNQGWATSQYPSEGREAVDRRTITLEPKDEDLIQQVYAANPNTVVVLVSSFPYAIHWIQQNIPAIVHLSHNSQEMGSALAVVLFGEYNPAGRLVQTWPASLDQVPELMDYHLRNGRTYMYFDGEPLYPFGYGLSYTTFEYTALRTSADSLGPQGSIEVEVEVRNSGPRDGEEVVQMYIRHPGSAVQRPAKALKGYRRLALQRGETRTVQLALAGRDLAFWDMAARGWRVESGRVEILVGPSSADRDLKLCHTIAVQGGPVSTTTP
jgi:beta-glucosidase